MKPCFAIFLSLIIAYSPCGVAEGNKIMKWVDKNGVTHYGDKPPMPEEAKQTNVLNKDGVTIKRIEQSSPKNIEAEQKNIEQLRHDAALLASYNSVEEIEIAKERNTKIDEYTLQGLLQKRETLMQDYKKNVAMINQHKKNGKSTPPELTSRKHQVVQEIKQTDSQIIAKRKDIQAIRDRYDKDKLRFAELKPRDTALEDIKHKKKTIAELETWREQTLSKVDSFKSELLKFKRANEIPPIYLSEGLLKSTEELARADEEIAAMKAAIKNNEQHLSR
jgi:hypothetical protein